MVLSNVGLQCDYFRAFCAVLAQCFKAIFLLSRQKLQAKLLRFTYKDVNILTSASFAGFHAMTMHPSWIPAAFTTMRPTVAPVIVIAAALVVAPF